MKEFYQLILIAAYIGYISCQLTNDLEVDIKKKIEEHLPEIDGLDVSQFNTSKLPKQEDVENVLKEKCKKNGAEDAVEKLKNQQDVLQSCIEKHVNYTVVEQELEEAKKTGSMDEVFGKYCRKWPLVYACFDEVIVTARTCMDEGEIVAFNKSLNILDELQEFMCFKDGDRLAMFVAEGGVECAQHQKEGIQNCLNATLGSRLPDTDDFSVATLPTFLFSDKDCNDFDTVRICVNKELEKCKNSTPANIVDALFKFLKKQMPCKPPIESGVTGAVRTSSSWSVKSCFASSMLSLIVLLGSRMF